MTIWGMPLAAWLWLYGLRALLAVFTGIYTAIGKPEGTDVEEEYKDLDADTDYWYHTF